MNNKISFFKGPRIMMKILIMSLLLAAGVCHAGNEIVGQWEISSGTDRVLTFEPEYIPYSIYYFAYTVTGNDENIVVSGRYRDIGPASTRQPKGRSSGMYVYLLNVKSGNVSLMDWDSFLALEVGTEGFLKKPVSNYPELNYSGEPDGFYHVLPIRKNGKEFVAAASFDGKVTDRTTFGIPGILPFMGRQKWFEEETYYSGTIFLEVFDKERPSKPIVQFKRSVRNLELLPNLDEMAAWTLGAEQPFLVIVERGNLMKKQMGRIFVVRP